MPKTLLFTSALSGVGVSTLSTVLAKELSKKKETLLIEVGKYPSVDLYLGLQNSVLYYFDDFIDSICDVEHCVVRANQGLSVGILKDKCKLLDFSDIVLERLRDFEFIIIDAMLDDQDVIAFLAAVDECFVVCTQEIAVMRSTEAYLAHLKSQGFRDIRLIVNKYRSCQINSSILENPNTASTYMDAVIGAVIAFDKRFMLGQNIVDSENGKVIRFAEKFSEEIMRGSKC